MKNVHTFADLSIVKARPECTMSFSEAPATLFWKATDGAMGILPTSLKTLSNDSWTDSVKEGYLIFWLFLPTLITIC